MRKQQVKLVFASIDKNGDDIASAEEITAALTRACVVNPAAEAASILEGKTQITLEEFDDMDKSDRFYSLALFAFTDTNNDGKINKEELSASVTKLDGPRDISELFAAMDTDHDGIVSYAELKAFFSHS